MSFDRLAPHYRWMEWLLAGGKLQRCRTAFIDALPEVQHALLLGEGNGRFLREFLLRQPGAQVTCFDASERMLQEVRRSVPNSKQVKFFCCDVVEWDAPRDSFDLVVSNFFLDCFRPEQIDLIAEKASATLVDGGHWLITDFCEPSRGWRKWRARIILQTMYCFFRWATDLPARRLTAPEAILARNGFKLLARQTFEWGLLHSDLWVCDHSCRAPENQFARAILIDGLLFAPTMLGS